MKMTMKMQMKEKNRLWNDWFRDGSVLRCRGNRQDNFTSSMPIPQKGPAVDFALLKNK